VKLPFEVGALYHRKDQIHAIFGGQEQGGISTPKNHPVIIAFTGEAGVSHGYHDFWDDQQIFHYFGEGQVGDMRYVGGNRAIEDHVRSGKQLILFQMMGKGRPYRYLGQFIALSSYVQPNTPDTNGAPRNAIVFRLEPVESQQGFDVLEESVVGATAEAQLGETAKKKLVEVRTKQRLFRDRLIGVEKGCRLTGIEDLRFLRASHIKPWSRSEMRERVDGQNGLLLVPHADLLFDRGWISFESNGRLLVAADLPHEVQQAIGLNLKQGRQCGSFTDGQQGYLSYHRKEVFGQRMDQRPPLVSDPASGFGDGGQLQAGY